MNACKTYATGSKKEGAEKSCSAKISRDGDAAAFTRDRGGNIPLLYFRLRLSPFCLGKSHKSQSQETRRKRPLNDNHANFKPSLKKLLCSPGQMRLTFICFASTASASLCSYIPNRYNHCQLKIQLSKVSASGKSTGSRLAWRGTWEMGAIAFIITRSVNARFARRILGQ